MSDYNIIGYSVCLLVSNLHTRILKRPRSRNEIVASILRSVTERGGLGITKIMYGSYLSYGQVTRFLQLIKENGLLDYDERIGLYKITEKGLQYLELYEKMDDLLKERRTSITDSLILLLLNLFYPLLPVLGEFI
jgi:predicted transcriptional regulator